ncbi:hypothetical protein C8R43DRAFT_945053 [Mycena crocata]|nr:hypothetical protein C8R43DRAFT_945053 [Mycena crocata]
MTSFELTTTSATLSLLTKCAVDIPKVRPSRFTLDPDLGPEDEDEREVSNSLSLSQSSSSSAGSSTSSSSSMAVDDLLRPDPRVNTPSSTPLTSPASSPARQPRIRPIPTPRQGPAGHRSRYTEEAYKARKHCGKFISFSSYTYALISSFIPDLSLLDLCWDGVQSGQFSTHPSSHPAYPHAQATTHRVLRPYDEKFYPGCLNRTYSHLLFLDTIIGQAVRALNSTMGIPEETFIALVQDSVSCPACACMFSEEGFNEHIRDGHCGNSPTEQPVVSRPTPDRPSIALRSMPAGKCLGKSAEYLDLPVGAALLEWNSKLGVPTDVWAVASTATTLCKTCELVRSFHGHDAHLHPVTGICNDVVDDEGETSSLSLMDSTVSTVEIFDYELRQKQSLAKNLVIYSHVLTLLMEIAWPTKNTIKLSPSQLVNLIIKQGLHWPCFCSRLQVASPQEEVLPARIMACEGKYFVYCAHMEPRCNFFIPLNQIYATATHTYEYPVSIASLKPYPCLLSSFLTERRPYTGFIAPQILPGYLGDHCSTITQGFNKVYLIDNLASTGRLGPYHTAASPLKYCSVGIQTEPEDVVVQGILGDDFYLELDDLNNIRKLCREGLHRQALEDLLKECPSCGCFFTGGHVASHAATCSPYEENTFLLD